MEIAEIHDKINSILNRRLPLGEPNSQCHWGICKIDNCQRCKDAVDIRNLLKELKHYGNYSRR